DTWLIWKLTNGKAHVTDYTNASRTMLFNINTLKWDQELLDLFEIPSCILPNVKECSEIYGYATLDFAPGYAIPISGDAGDQQAALFGQCCFEKGQAKNTYGTGCFLLLNTGTKPVYSKNGLLTTIALGYKGKITYALEGSVYIGGSVIQFLRDGFKMMKKSSEATKMATDVATTDGVYFVPALTGLGSPYWDNEARGAIFGLTRGITKEHLVRAAVEAIAFQSKDVMDVMQKESHVKLTSLSVDGGATANNFLMQFQADILNVKINLPEVIETTALGAAYLAGLAVGFYTSLNDIKKNHTIVKTFSPGRSDENVMKIYKGWKKAVAATRSFK
ncbi:MAG: glycerol kinase GlpK, partial [Bacilli bacterium]|nr:glycerol kinase GlpK [Bacilli bacterium]